MANLPVLKLITGFFKIILMTIGAWFLVHFFALSGVFVSIAHTLLWFFFPRSTICVKCVGKKEGYYCKLCNQTKESNNSNHAKSLKAAIYSSFILLILSIISIGVIYLESKILNSILYPISEKTVSFVIPSQSQYMIGEIFPMEIKLVGIEKTINAIQADLGFDKERLEVVDISTKGSFANVFLQKEYNNELGYARLSGGLPNPGFNAPEGVFGTVYFKSKVAGLAQVFFLDTSLVLANDGSGTNVLKEYSTISYLITPERVAQDTEVLQQQLLINDVLGAEEEGDEQILLFDNTNNVLGTKDISDLDVRGLEDIDEDDSIGFKLLHILESFDSFILGILNNIFTFIDSQLSNLFR